MSAPRLCLHTDFDGNNKPQSVTVKVGNKTIQRDLYKPGTGKTIKAVADDVAIIRNIVTSWLTRGAPLVTDNFKANFHYLDLPFTTAKLTAYDVGEQGPDTIAKLETAELSQHAWIKANAAVVYQHMETTGVYFDSEHVHPTWSLDTYSGRSRCSGPNVQGTTDESLGSPIAPDRLFVHCDWISADFRVAALLSGDENLERSFIESDPYEFAATELVGLELSRDDVKDRLLRSVNSLNSDDPVLTAVYPRLAEWVAEQRTRVERDGELTSLLGRRFQVTADRSVLAAFNATLQGSVAHAVQATLRAVWETNQDWPFCDIHDSVVLTCPKDELSQLLACLKRTMLHPFVGVLENNPAFPFRISVGKYWRNWREVLTVRAPA